MARGAEELVFVPLGGVGEIGMNASLYGFGLRPSGTGSLVDCGVAFAGPDLPGVDLIMPDIRFIEERRSDLAALIITHAHEDHIGAVADSGRGSRVPVYLTQFAAAMLEAKRLRSRARRRCR
jgi:ribonuclease J